MSVLAFESVVVGLAALPAVACWSWLLRWATVPSWLRVVLLAMAFVPAYLLFALALVLASALGTRLLGWRTPANVATRIADYEWTAVNWARYLASIHVVRVLAGAVFRSTPLWTLYVRLNGARVGRGVWINSLSVMDHNLLELGDGVVIGSDVHLAAHIVERGVLTTAPVRIEAHVTIGVGTVVEIGAHLGAGAQVGALSVVPKHARLEPGRAYAGAPVHPVEPRAAAPAPRPESDVRARAAP